MIYVVSVQFEDSLVQFGVGFSMPFAQVGVVWLWQAEGPWVMKMIRGAAVMRPRGAASPLVVGEAIRSEQQGKPSSQTFFFCRESKHPVSLMSFGPAQCTHSSQREI